MRSSAASPPLNTTCRGKCGMTGYHTPKTNGSPFAIRATFGAALALAEFTVRGLTQEACSARCHRAFRSVLNHATHELSPLERRVVVVRAFHRALRQPDLLM